MAAGLQRFGDEFGSASQHDLALVVHQQPLKGFSGKNTLFRIERRPPRSKGIAGAEPHPRRRGQDHGDGRLVG